jgi:hypothetical protein
MAVARKASRQGHRDATMILIAFRHGVRRQPELFSHSGAKERRTCSSRRICIDSSPSKETCHVSPSQISIRAEHL